MLLAASNDADLEMVKKFFWLNGFKVTQLRGSLKSTDKTKVAGDAAATKPTAKKTSIEKQVKPKKG